MVRTELISYLLELATQVTVVNPPFLKLMQQYEPSGIISTLSQEVFASIKVSRCDKWPHSIIDQ